MMSSNSLRLTKTENYLYREQGKQNANIASSFDYSYAHAQWYSI